MGAADAQHRAIFPDAVGVHEMRRDRRRDEAGLLGGRGKGGEEGEEHRQRQVKFPIRLSLGGEQASLASLRQVIQVSSPGQTIGRSMISAKAYGESAGNVRVGNPVSRAASSRASSQASASASSQPAFQAWILSQLPFHAPPLLADRDRPGAAARDRLMIPLQQVMHQHSQRALQTEILLLAHVVDLLGDGGEVEVAYPPLAQQRRRLASPGIEIPFLRDEAFRLRLGRPRTPWNRSPQLSATFSALSGSSWPKQRW